MAFIIQLEPSFIINGIINLKIKTMLLTFLWISTMAFIMLFVIWSKRTFLDFAIKVGFLMLYIMGIVLILVQYGLLKQ